MTIHQRQPVVGPWKIRTTETDSKLEAVPSPYPVVSGFAIDGNGYFPLLYRGDKVRSAKNCWSLPSGQHECGFTMAEQFAIELKEELGLDADVGSCLHVATYENIAMVDSWHWVINMLVIRVKTLETLVNKEPDKHPKMDQCHTDDIATDDFAARPWAPHLGLAINSNLLRIQSAARRLRAYEG